ncbi:MAG: YfiR family protein, partial [Burkholderiales bacterium]|nr:YfiR family protein [Opitutaceae bacterium]
RPRLLAFLLALACLCSAAGARAETISKEYQLKAAFLYNFSKFTQWPEQSFANETSPIVIAVLGPSPFGDELEKIVEARVVNGRPIRVRRIDSATDLASAHIVYVAAGAEPLLGATIHGLPGVLTVGETADFAARGGIVRFTLVEEKVRFEINQGSAEKAGLKLSGQLLKLATLIRKAP